MAREKRLALADMRAMEEQSERHNPINPKSEIGTRKGYTGILRGPAVVVKGAGATPSMGLSTVRGGGLLGQDGHGQRVVGAGTKKGQTRKTARKAYEDIGRREVALHRAEHRALEEEEEKGGALSGGAKLGKQLGERMLELHGSGFWDDFKKGFMMVAKPAAGVAKAVLPLTGPAGTAASAALGALGAGSYSGGLNTGAYEGKGRRRGSVSSSSSEEKEEKMEGGVKLTPEEDAVGYIVMLHKSGDELENIIMNRHKLSKANAKKVIAKAEQRVAAGRLMRIPERMAEEGLVKMKHGSGAMSGGGFLSDLGIPVVSDVARAVGLGKGKKKRAAGGPSDKRRARGAMVSKLMKEKGMSLAEASKHIKEHGLV